MDKAPTALRAKAIGQSKYCGAPLCTEQSSTGRRLLSTAEVRSNGFPELTTTTIASIGEDFCAILTGGCDTDSAGAYNGVTSGYTADLDRADVVAGAIQLAFHDAGTYDPTNTTAPGGPDGCACDKKDENAGLDYIKDILEPIYEKYSDYLSLADFWVVCANVAIEVSVPKNSVIDNAFQYGRSDHDDCDGCALSVANRLPDSSLSTDHVLEVFQDRMGFNKSEIVALMGAHSLGRMEFNNSGHEGIWDQTPAKLDQRYFIAILSFTWCRFYVNQTGNDYSDSQYKYEWRVPNEMSESMTYFDMDTPKLINTDMCLGWDIGDADDEVNENTCPTKCMAGDAWDECTNAASEGDTMRVAESTTSPDSPSGQLTLCNKQTNGMRDYVEAFASDVDVFLPAFVAAFKKLTELGQTDLTSPTEVTAPSDLAYSDCSSTCKVCAETAITEITASYSGSTVTAFTASDLPAGMSIDATTGTISGTPTTESSSTAYTITATNDAGSDTVVVRYKVLATTKSACSTMLVQKTPQDSWVEQSTPGSGEADWEEQ